MIVLRPIMRLMVAAAIFRDAFKRRRDPLEDCHLHVGALRTSDVDRIMGRHR